MPPSRHSLAAALCVVLLPAMAFAQAPAAPPVTADDLLSPGPEAQALSARAGIWDVSFTSWDRPGAAPITLTGLVAERRMFGPMLQEILQPAPHASVPGFVRVDQLTYNRLEGRWDYVSMDSRAASGLMPAWSLDHDPAPRIFLSFQPFASALSPLAPAGSPVAVGGTLTRMEQVDTMQDADHETKDQYFTFADGVATKWLFKRYSYVRRSPS